MSQVCMTTTFYSRSEGALGSTKTLKRCYNVLYVAATFTLLRIKAQPSVKKNYFHEKSLPYGQHPHQKDSIQHLTENALKPWL